MSISKIQVAPNGPQLSRIILGLWRIADGIPKSSSEVIKLVEESIELGITTFDHADIYGGYSCEGIFGEAMKLNPGLRSKMQLITKCGIKLISGARPEHKIKSYNTSKEHITWSAENSLKALNTDFIDVLLIHRPDYLMDPDDVAYAFEKLKKSGKVLHFGVSNFLPHQFDLLQSRLDFPLITNQMEISLLSLSPFVNGQLDQCLQKRISPMAWSPFGGGTIFKEEGEQAKRIHKTLEEVGKRHDNATVEQLLIAFLLRHPSKILPILGTGKIERVKALADVEKITLSYEDWYEIWTASTGIEIP